MTYGSVVGISETLMIAVVVEWGRSLDFFLDARSPCFSVLYEVRSTC